MAATTAPPRLLPSGDSAITVEFCRNIDDAANRRVLALDRAMAEEPIAASPKRCRLIARCWCITIPCKSISKRSANRLLTLAQRPVPATTRARRWRIPVVYGGEHGIDLEDVAKTLKTTPEDIVARHVAGDYRVAMIGFTPGWSYLSGLDAFATHAAAAKSAAVDAGRHDLDRWRADRRAMPGWPERLASARTNRRQNLSAAPRSRFSCWSPATRSPSRRSIPGRLPNRTAQRKPANSSRN